MYRGFPKLFCPDSYGIAIISHQESVLTRAMKMRVLPWQAVAALPENIRCSGACDDSACPTHLILNFIKRENVPSYVREPGGLEVECHAFNQATQVRTRVLTSLFLLLLAF